MLVDRRSRGVGDMMMFFTGEVDSKEELELRVAERATFIYVPRSFVTPSLEYALVSNSKILVTTTSFVSHARERHATLATLAPFHRVLPPLSLVQFFKFSFITVNSLREIPDLDPSYSPLASTRPS